MMDVLVSMSDGLYRIENAYSDFLSDEKEPSGISILCRPRPFLTATHIEAEKATANTQAANIHQSSCLTERTR